MREKKNIRVGIGFATGRKSFQKVLRTYIYNWTETEAEGRDGVELDLLVAYDLAYSNTRAEDFTRIGEDVRNVIGNRCFFLSGKTFDDEISKLSDEGIITREEAKIVFGGGYAGKRNAVLYGAVKNKLDCLIFLDDDEYPMAVTKTRATAVWGGQPVFSTHLRHVFDADITNGHHCGYISPIPYITYNETLREADFRKFIEAISNDIIRWDTISAVMKNGGVTYADTGILMSDRAEEVEEIHGAKFISGANLCLNLRDPARLRPFYNPPGARGEDTFLSTLLSDRTVLRVPCYTFHDGFSTYRHLMDGVLPTRLSSISADSEDVITRFYRACIGWVRYKPLLLYITRRDEYEEKIREMRQNLVETIPRICEYFGRPEFMDVLVQLDKYSANVKKHHSQFLRAQEAWEKIMRYLASS